MIRSFAKFLIQYSLDSSSVSTNADRLPNWLRRWVNSDPSLHNFERELLGLESQLVGQADKHVAHKLSPRSDFVSVAHTKLIPDRSVLRSPVALAAIAASMACVLLVGRWIVFSSTREAPVSKVVVDTERKVLEKNSHERWIRSTLSASKRLASKVKEKGNEATGSLVIASRTLNQESELVKIAGLEGLRFVAQKLPAATVRMVAGTLRVP